MSGYLQPRSGNPLISRGEDNGDPFMPFRRQMNRMFDDFLGAPLLPRFPMPMPALARVLEVVASPQIEVSETNDEVLVTAELPGIDPNKVEVSLTDEVLTIRAEKQQQQDADDDGRDFHLSERSYGTFARYLRLPFHADPDKVQATFKDGVLTVRIPKPEEVRQTVHKIPVATESQSATGSPQQPTGAPDQQASAAD